MPKNETPFDPISELIGDPNLTEDQAYKVIRDYFQKLWGPPSKEIIDDVKEIE